MTFQTENSSTGQQPAVIQFSCAEKRESAEINLPDPALKNAYPQRQVGNCKCWATDRFAGFQITRELE
jgi:hypothetical protein